MLKVFVLTSFFLLFHIKNDTAVGRNSHPVISVGGEIAKRHGFNPAVDCADIKDVLFVVKHSKSPNMVVYKAKRALNKELDPQKPIDVFWLMITKGQKTEALTFIEWKLAFGFTLQTIVKGSKYKITLNAIKNQHIYIYKNQHGQVEGFMKLNGHLAKLKEVFINFEPSFLMPDVKYVDFTGTDIKSGKAVTQRFKKE